MKCFKSNAHEASCDEYYICIECSKHADWQHWTSDKRCVPLCETCHEKVHAENKLDLSCAFEEYWGNKNYDYGHDLDYSDVRIAASEAFKAGYELGRKNPHRPEEPFTFPELSDFEFRKLSIKLGIHNPDGTLTEKYQTPADDLPKPRKKKKSKKK